MSRILLLILIISFSILAQALNRAYYFGGGGESKEKEYTIFDYSFSTFTAIEDRGWSVKYLFDGSHPISQSLLKAVGKNGQSFTTKAAIERLNEIEALLADPSQKTEQLLIYIDTHGSNNDGKYTIATDDGYLEILPQLKRIKALAKKRKTRLGIVGATCFSGNLLPLGDKNTCVLTAAPRDTVGYKELTDYFSYHIATGTKNLETLHLQSRVNGNQRFGQPLISTSEGKMVYEILNPLRNELLVASRLDVFCDHNSFRRAIHNLSELKNKVADDFLKDQLQVQAGKIDKIRKSFSELKKTYGSQAETLLQQECVDVVIKDLKYPGCFRSPKVIESSKEFFMKEYERLKTAFQDPNSDGKDKVQISMILSQTSQVLDLIDGIMASEQFKNKEKLYNQLNRETALKINELSSEVVAVERDLYSRLYKYFQSKNKNLNACSKFLF